MFTCCYTGALVIMHHDLLLLSLTDLYHLTGGRDQKAALHLPSADMTTDI